MQHNNKPGNNMTSELDRRRKAYRRCYSIQPEFSNRYKEIHSIGNIVIKPQSTLVENDCRAQLEHHQQQQPQLRKYNKALQHQFNCDPSHCNVHLNDVRKSFCFPSNSQCRSFDAGANDGCQFRYEEHRGSNLVLQHITGRRGSFLYRQDTNSGHSHYSSRHESITGDELSRQ
ncbi:unnamed protein product [Trichobilharzia szidati]|nr:unnamed protein product [Trichobilharzia szidati]